MASNSKKVVTYRQRMKLRAVEYKGGKCERCGYNRCVAALQFHHPDPTVKSFGIAYKGLIRRWGVLKPELDKTLMLCANCHAEEHWRLKHADMRWSHS